MKTAILASMAALAGFATPLCAQSQFEDLDALDARISVASAPAVAQPLDRRLKLARCAEGAVIEAAGLGSLAVRCTSTGWRIRVPVMSGAGYAAASAAPVIHRGENVEIVIGGENYEVVATGTALEDGSQGKAIRVKFLTATAAMTATVTGPGKVFVED